MGVTISGAVADARASHFHTGDRPVTDSDGTGYRGSDWGPDRGGRPIHSVVDAEPGIVHS